MRKIIQWFTGPIDGIVERHQARSIVIFLSTIIIISIILWPFSEQFGSEFPFIVIIIVTTFLLFLYKITKSNVLVGNLSALLIYVAIFDLSFKSGGIYSLDISGLVLVPIIAINMTGWRSSILWTLACIIPIVYHYNSSLELENLQLYKEQILSFKMNYFLMLHLVLLILPMIMVFLYTKLNGTLVAEIKNRNNDLDQANEILANQTIQLTQTKNALEDSNTLLKKYAHITSHDLKQPIRTIASFTQLLNRELKKDSPNKENLQSYLQHISDGSIRMNSQVEEILSYSKNTNEDLVQKTDINNIIDQVMADLTFQIKESNIQLKVSGLPTIDGVPSTIYKLFQNLISNAVKYKHPERDLTLNIAAKEESDAWTFSVEDNGIGIPEDKIEVIFDSMTQLNSQIEGAGIGLNTVKEFVEKLGGKIWVQSKEGMGSTFSFTYPKL